MWCNKNLKLYDAFTLIELILVLLIISILAAVAGPRFFSISSYEKNFFYHEARSTLSYARKLAITTGCHVQVNISNNNLVLRRRTGTLCTATTAAFTVDIKDPISNASNYIRTAPTGVTISPTSLQIYFDSLGRIHSSSDNSINNYTLTIGGRNINLIGQTGLLYES